MSAPDQTAKLHDLPGQVSNKLSYAHEEGDLDEASGLTHEELAFVREFPEDKKKKVLWKVDVRLVPFLTLLYLFAYIDRANIGNAKIEGLVEDLGMTDDQYRICLSIFYVPYILFESGFFPGSILIISKWYLPNETQTRIAVFYTASALAGAFSGMLAAGIAQMDGVGGLEGWRWIFLLEGIVTVLLGVLTYFWLIDSPALSSGWLEPDEIRYLELRQRADPSRRAMARAKSEGSGSDTRKALISVLCDWQIWMHGIIYWSNTVPNNALKFTMPQIVRNMGFEATRAQLLTIPPYIIGAISAFVSSWFADRFSWRMPFIVGPQLVVIVAYSVLFAMAGDITNNVPACYFSICLACLGLYPINPCGNAWNLNNLAGPSKRAMGIAFMLCIGNVGGIIGGFIYIDSEKPKYPTGFGSSLGFVAAGVLACLVVEALYKYINTQRAKMTEEEVFAKYTPEELDAMGDRSPLYRYTL
ncbi:MFS domain-containing protein [Fusarium falciforme]|uniref:MFS domain-containing protein n=1 Tax=Fusarium falciforme TaxID=195108 RepID=UPI002300C123|nr:MFS domain-containing protein [Fusarium falciforme]WAO91764.1 MFS domain-containing protein [Fusarium falciforme]